MFKGIGSIIYKETLHVTRDPKTLLLMLMVPAFQIIIFGYAIDMDVKNIPTVLYNLDNRPESRQLVDAFQNSGYFNIIEKARSDEEMNRSIVRGTTHVGLKIPPDFSDNVLRGLPATIQVLIDGSDSTVASQALNVSNAIAMDRSLRLLSQRLNGEGGGMLIESRPRMLFNPTMATSQFMVPGLVAIVMQVVTMFLTAFAIVREKETGTMEQLIATPVSRLGLVCGKLIPFAVIGSFETLTVLVIMRLQFGVPIAGNLVLLAVCCLIFLCTSLGMGLVVSTFAESQIQAMQIAYVIMLPSILLSGFVFPQETMPWPIYWLGQLIPVTYFIRMLRGIILRGAGMEDIWMHAVPLIVMGVLLLGLSTWRFRKTIN